MYSRQVFFFNDTATTEIYTLSLHDALPIYPRGGSKDYPRLFPAPRTRPIFRPAETQIPAELSGHIRYRIFSFPRSNKAPASTDDRNRALRPSRLFFRREKARKDRWAHRPQFPQAHLRDKSVSNNGYRRDPRSRPIFRRANIPDRIRSIRR